MNEEMHGRCRRSRGFARRGSFALLAVLAFAAAAAPASAQVELVSFSDQSYAAPRHLAGDPSDPSRVFVVEAGGTIRLIEGGITRAPAFLNISADVCAPADGCGGESGLFSIAFAPDYASSGLFYVFFTRAVPAGTHELVIREFRAADPNDADEGAGRDVLVIPHPVNQNHNGGQLQFGPDGHLYIATGDGGGANDPRNNAQNLSSLLGKLLRIDPAGAAPGQYSIPPDNPFAGATPGRDEIYAYGLRNPYRFSFDRITGDLAIGDVGQGAWEEIDFMPSGTALGANFGWDCFEGSALATSATKPIPDPQCAPAPGNHTPPVLEYARPPSGAAVNGGYVVRDPSVPSLFGRYVYADSFGALPGDAIFSAVLVPGGHSGSGPTGLSLPFVVSFGEDAAGRVYVVSGAGGVYRIEEESGGGSAGGGSAGATPGLGRDRLAPGLEVDAGKIARRAAKRGRVTIKVGCDEPCTVSAEGEIATRGKDLTLDPSSAPLAAGVPARLDLELSGKETRRLRKALRLRRRAATKIEIVATDVAGNASGERREFRQKR